MDAMPTVPRQSLGADPHYRAGLRPPMVLGIAALHVALLCGVGSLFHARRTPPPAEMSIPVVFLPAASVPYDPSPIFASRSLPTTHTEEPAVLAPSPTLTLPQSQAVSMSRPSPPSLHRDLGHTSSIPASRTLAPQAVGAAALPKTAMPPGPLQAMAPAAADMSPRAMAGWEARIRQAVQDAAIYPAAARLLHRHGSAQIRFDYRLGAIVNAGIAQTSHVDILDHAALAAVTRAVIPDPPAELGPQKRTMLVWVQFSLSSED